MKISNSLTNFSNKYFKNKYKEQKNHVDELDGNWFVDSCFNIMGNYYVGENVLSELLEGYINVFVSSNLNFNSLINSISHIKNRLIHEENIHWLYIELSSDDEQLLKDARKTLDNELHGAKVISITIEKELNNEQDSKIGANNNVRLFSREDLPSLYEYFMKAFKNGIPDNMLKTINMEKLYENMKNYFYDEYKKGGFSIIYEIESKIYGHATYLHQDENQVKLFDMYVEEQFENQNVSQLLESLGESECLKRNYSKITGSIESKVKDIFVILKHLEKKSWHIGSLVYLQKLV